MENGLVATGGRREWGELESSVDTYVHYLCEADSSQGRAV